MWEHVRMSTLADRILFKWREIAKCYSTDVLMHESERVIMKVLQIMKKANGMLQKERCVKVENSCSNSAGH